MNTEFGGRLVAGKIHVSIRVDSIIGWFHQRDIIVYLGSNEVTSTSLREKVEVVQVPVKTSTYEEDFPDVFNKGLGYLKNYIHFIKREPMAKPKVSKIRNVSVIVKDAMA